MAQSSNAADRNLLYGILAVQMDFISRDHLIAGMNAWIIDKAKPLAAILHDQGALSAEHRQLLDTMVAAHIKQHGGDPQQSLAAVGSATSIRGELKQIADPDVYSSLAHVGAAVDPYATAPSPFTSNTGVRYRILRPHARGGLGEVFVAQDSELHRHVALKEIQARHADDAGSRGRFMLEAEITGGLEHPGIVPVYGLGTYADGRPYYAMRFIRGDNLKEAISQFHRRAPTDYQSVEFRQLLGRFVDVCNAVAYAHSRGVLHRDLKPGNVMLGKFGETLVVDWGLAKPVRRVGGVERSDDGEEEATLRPLSGSAVAGTVIGTVTGTPPFMSPEQASGKIDELGPAADVYSLGATLFCLLTNRAPIGEQDMAEVLLKAQRGDAGFAAPTTSAKGIPPALVAVCKKAMALKPADRYASPLDLAADLEHWLGDEPVAAAREPLSVRARRWMRKHPAAVSGIVAAVLVTVVGLSIGAIVLGEKNQALANVNTKLDTANNDLTTSNHDLTTTNEKLDLARRDANNKRQMAEDEKQIAQAVRNFLQDHLLRQANPWEQANQVLMSKINSPVKHDITVRELLHRAGQEFSPEIIDTKFPNQPQVQAEVLETIGESYQAIGEHKQAVSFVRAAYLVREKAFGPDHPATFGSMTNLVFVYVTAKHQLDAARTMITALERLEKVLESTSSIGGVEKNKGIGPAEEGALAIIRAIRRRSDLKRFSLPRVSFGAESPLVLIEVASVIPRLKRIANLAEARFGRADERTCFARLTVGFAHHAVGELPKALEIYEDVHEIADRILDSDDVLLVGLREVLAVTYKTQPRLRDKAIALEEKICETLKRTIGLGHPATAISMGVLAEDYLQAGKTASAVQMFEHALRLKTGHFGPKHNETAVATMELAVAYHADGKLKAALPHFEKAFEIRKEILGIDDRETIYSLGWLGVAYCEDHRPHEGISCLEDACSKAARHESLQWIGPALLNAYINVGKTKEASTLIVDQLKQTRVKLTAKSPQLAGVLAANGLVLLNLKAYAEAETLLRECLTIRENSEPGAWTTCNTRSMLGGALLGQNKMEKYKEAEDLLKEGYAGMKAREKTIPPPGLPRLAEALERLVHLYEATGNTAEAERYRKELAERKAVQKVPTK